MLILPGKGEKLLCKISWLQEGSWKVWGNTAASKWLAPTSEWSRPNNFLKILQEDGPGTQTNKHCFPQAVHLQLHVPTISSLRTIACSSCLPSCCWTHWLPLKQARSGGTRQEKQFGKLLIPDWPYLASHAWTLLAAWRGRGGGCWWRGT